MKHIPAKLLKIKVLREIWLVKIIVLCVCVCECLISSIPGEIEKA